MDILPLALFAVLAVVAAGQKEDQFVYFDGNSVVMQCPRSKPSTELPFWWYEINVQRATIPGPPILKNNRFSHTECKEECGKRNDCYAAMSTCLGQCYMLTTTAPKLCQQWYSRKEGKSFAHCSPILPCKLAYKICTKPRCSLANMAKQFCDTNNAHRALTECDMSVDSVGCFGAGDSPTGNNGRLSEAPWEPERPQKNEGSTPTQEAIPATDAQFDTNGNDSLQSRILEAKGYLLIDFSGEEIPGVVTERACAQPNLSPIDCKSAQFSDGKCYISDQEVEWESAEPGNGSYFGKYDIPSRLVMDCSDQWEEFPQKILDGPITLVNASSYAHCLQACLMAEEEHGFICKSGQFYFEEENYNCHLNEESKETRSDLFSTAGKGDSVVYFEPKCDESTAAEQTTLSEKRGSTTAVGVSTGKSASVSSIESTLTPGIPFRTSAASGRVDYAASLLNLHSTSHRQDGAPGSISTSALLESRRQPTTTPSSAKISENSTPPKTAPASTPASIITQTGSSSKPKQGKARLTRPSARAEFSAFFKTVRPKLPRSTRDPAIRKASKLQNRPRAESANRTTLNSAVSPLPAHVAQSSRPVPPRTTMSAKLINNLVKKVFGIGEIKILDCPSGNRSKYLLYNTYISGVSDSFDLAAQNMDDEHECRILCYNQPGCYLAVVTHGSKKCYTLSKPLPGACNALQGGFGDDKHIEKCGRNNRCEWIMKMCRKPYCTLLEIANVYCKTKDKEQTLKTCNGKIPYQVWA